MKILTLLAAFIFASLVAHAAEPPHILLREALQFENIGDSGRVPGTLRLIREHLPEAEVTLWPWQLHQERERELFLRAFPKLRIVNGEVDDSGKASTAELAAAWKDADILITPGRHARFFTAWAKTGRPYGLFGSAFDPVTHRQNMPDGGTLAELGTAIEKLPPGNFDQLFKSREIYDGASFIFARDTLSLRYLKQQNLRPSVLELGLDGTFGIAVRDDARATRWLRRIGVEEGKFICVLPRLRYTPYYQVRQLPRDESDYELDAVNAKHASHDHAPLRDLITLYVRETGHKVLLCPEMTYEIAVAKEHLFDPLPADVKPHVIWRDTFWLADEAASVYAHATAIVSAECHSPIIALSQGTPAFYVRNSTDTVKAQMFADLGLGDWIFESSHTTGQQLWEKLKPLHEDRTSARTRVQRAMTQAAAIQKRMVEVLSEAVAKPKPNADPSAGIDPDDGTGPRPDKTIPPKLIPNPCSTADYNRAKRTCTGVPSIAVSRSGRLWAAWFSGTTPGEIIERCPNAYVVVSTSGDGGKSWKEVLAIDPDGPGPLKAYDPHPWIDPDGKLWVFFTLPYPLHKHAWAITAEDGDQESPAWSPPRPAFEGVLLNKPTVLANGDWLFPTYARRPENMGAILSQVSRNQGRTFTVKGQMLVSWDLFPSEPMAVERKDGSLWMLVRTAKGIGESLSTDGGATWSPLKTPAILHTPSRFFIGRLQSGNLLLVKHLGIDEDPLWGGKAKQRRELTAFLSKDDGKTWSGGLVLDERVGCSYPDAQQAADGTLYFCWDYQRSREQELWMTTFREEDVLAANDEATARVKSNRRLISKGGTPE